MYHRNLTDDEVKQQTIKQEQKCEETYKLKLQILFIKIKTFFSNLIF